MSSSSSNEQQAASSEQPPATTSAVPPPTFDGKRVLPYRVLTAGLKGSTAVAAVYAVCNNTYKRGQEGWDAAVHVGVTQDLQATLQSHAERHGTSSVAHVRALSFAVPQPTAMQQVSQQWRQMAIDAGASLDGSWADDVLSYLYDDDDEDDDDEFDWETTANAMATVGGGSSPPVDDTIISPFDDNASSGAAVTSSSDVALEFTAENVDNVLNEVRPYLISDGGNVSVERVDEATKNVYLKLEGACGSCASSTVTMQMGIERVLRENFADLNEVLQVESENAGATELTFEAVQEEVGRLANAIVAMGGVVRLLEVEPSTGRVKMMFRGPAKVQQGLELAVRDVPFVETVEIVQEE